MVALIWAPVSTMAAISTQPRPAARLTRVYCSRSGARHALCELSRPADSAAAGEVIGADTPPRRDVLKVKGHARLVTENA